MLKLRGLCSILRPWSVGARTLTSTARSTEPAESATRAREDVNQTVNQQAVSEFAPDDVKEKSTDVKRMNPLEDYFDVKSLFTLKDLFKARVHLGHKTGVRDDFMKRYLYGTRLNVDILDLDMTVPLLQKALNFTAHVAYREGIILFISRDPINLPIIEKTALEAGEYSHCRVWLGGTFTNSTVQFGGMTRLPDLCIFLNCQNHLFNRHLAVIEAAKMNIPTVGIVDSSTDPRLISYPVPGNDDSPLAVELYCRLFKEAILRGKQRREEDYKL